jgi:SAM-dependent methyltransferase
VEEVQVCCPTCLGQWENRDGIPRFYNPDYYWGEVPQKEASLLLSQARTLGWREAVQQRFQYNPPLVYSILQWQSRASWLPLLGLNDRAVALDIGSGYGSITHALAKAAKEVYSVEAIPERIDFSSIRFRQEGLSNVRLIQASATDLPLQDNAFDLVVVNGILEWIGEWDLSVPPQEVQLRFLRKIHDMLKPGGILLLGIENRIGYNNFRGARDHSGLPYTSLLPRWLATIVLRRSRQPHHRTQLNAKREYRTYTYSELGYRRILGKSGLRELTFHAADPGYNQPLSLVPLDRNALAAHTLRKISEPTHGSRPRWPRLAKFYLSRLGFLRPFVPEFVIFARKRRSDETSR